MSHTFKLTAFLLLLVGAAESRETADSAADTSRVVIVIPVVGNVDPGMAAFIGRAIRDGLEHPAPYFVLDMDTFGGRVDAALDIVDTLVSLPEGATMSFVRKRAISAGALIALSCSKLIMRPNTTIGDCAPIAYSGEGPEVLGEKFQSPLRAKFRALAKRNGYPATLSEAMVTAEMSVYQVELPDTTLYLDSLELAELAPSRKAAVISQKTVVPAGELLTMDAQEAQELGFSSKTAASIEKALEAGGIENYKIIRIEENWSEAFVRIIGRIAPILMMIGFAALYAELKSPGFGIPGIVGIICLALVFGGQFMVGLADYTELLLIVVGILLLATELFVLPGFGVIGIVGMAFIAAGMVLSLQDFVIPEPSFPWQVELLKRNLFMVLISLCGSLILLLLFFRYVFPQLGRVVSGPYLSETLASSRLDSDVSPKVAVGDEGVVVTTLRPSGKAQINDEVIDVTTEEGFYEKGTPVRVARIQGNSTIVEKVENQRG
ncbi:MAG: serine protease [Chitinivibrionales bacterium]|nr:serine protease [Chitinivibrionales bacterium]MBD3355658.1 serine protease [Chitinivibrionales bacterium]